jgi:hypothetical protein
MQKLISMRPGWAIAIFIVIDTICVGIGMGVPFLNILFGFVVGWYITRRISLQTLNVKQTFGKVMQAAALTSAYTFLMMAVIWFKTFMMLFDPAADLAHWGIPMILYEPRASFIGWLVLMVFISPFLQFLITLFASNMTLLWKMPGDKKPNPE